MREWLEAKAQCHTDNGFPAVVQPDGGISTDIAPGQSDDYQRMTQECDEQVRARLGPPMVEIPYTEHELSALHDLLLEQARCLKEAGYPVPEATSKDVFVERYLALYAGTTGSDSLPWDPLALAADPDAESQCPSPTGQDVAAHADQGD